ncbi:MAG: hypothetical protein ABI442_17630 [Gemmatimonadaceae bacterium]
MSSESTPTSAPARPIIYLGMDVHKESITIAVLSAGAKAPTHLERLPNDLAKLKKWLTVTGTLTPYSAPSGSRPCPSEAHPKAKAVATVVASWQVFTRENLSVRPGNDFFLLHKYSCMRIYSGVVAPHIAEI